MIFDIKIKKEGRQCCDQLLLEVLLVSWQVKSLKSSSMGIIANVFAGLVGAYAGQSLLGSWGPSIAGMALLPSIVGAAIVITVVSFFTGRK